MRFIVNYGAGGATLLRGPHMRPPKTKPSTGANQFEGFEQQTQQDDVSLGTQQANEARIRELGALMDAAAKAGDLAAYKQHQAEYAEALKRRSPEQIERLNAEHLAAVERAVALGDRGIRYVPAGWLETESGRAVAWRTSRPVDAAAEAWRAA